MTPFTPEAPEDEITPFSTLDERIVQRRPNARSIAQVLAAASVEPSDLNSPLLTTLGRAIDNLTEVVRLKGDEPKRLEIAGNERMKAVQDFAAFGTESLKFDPTGAARNAAATAATIRLSTDLAEEAKVAAEKKAVENIQTAAALGQDSTAALMLRNLEDGTAADIRADWATKALILRREIDKLDIDIEEQGILTNVFQGIFSWGLAPLAVSAAKAGNVPSARKPNIFDEIWSGGLALKEGETLDSMTVEEFTRNLPTILENIRKNATVYGLLGNKQIERNVLNNLVNTEEPWVADAFNTLDNIVILGPIAKGAGSIPGIIARAGNRSLLEKSVTQAAEELIAKGADNTGVAVTEVTGNMVPSSMNISGTQAASVSPAVGVQANMDAVRVLSETVAQSNRLLPNEIADAVSAKVEEVRKLGGVVADVRTIAAPQISGTTLNQVEIVLKNPDAPDGFATAAEAQKYVEDLGFFDLSIETRGTKAPPASVADRELAEFYGLTHKIVEDTSGVFYPAVRLNVDETGFFTNTLKPTIKHRISSWVLGSRQTDDPRMYEGARAASNKSAGILAQLTSTYERVFQKASSLERETAAAVLAKQTNASRWFTEDEIRTIYQSARHINRLPSSNEIDIFRAARELYDLDHVFHQNALYVEGAAKGLETVDILGVGVKQANAKVTRSLGAMPDERMFDVSANAHRRAVTPNEWQYYKDNGYQLIELEDAKELADGTQIRLFLSKPTDIKTVPLREDLQLPYKPGGMRAYENMYPVKQGKYFSQPDEAASRALTKPTTFRIMKTKAQADEWARVMEDARQAFKAGDMNGVDVALKSGRGGAYPTAKEFGEMVTKGQIDKDLPFESLYDRQSPSIYAETRNNLRFAEDGEPGYLGLVRSTEGLRTGGKGEQLLDFEGRLSPTIDPYEAINATLNNLTRVIGWNDYKIEAVSRFDKTFGKYVDYDGPNSPIQRLLHGTVSRDTPVTIQNEMLSQRESILRNLGWRTPEQRMNETMYRSAADWIGGDEIAGWRTDLAALVSQTKGNPLNYIRGIAFDLKLGLFNPGQILLQTSTLFSALALRPRMGLQALSQLTIMRSYMASGGKRAVAEAWAKKGLWKMGEFESVDEFYSFLEDFRKSNVAEVKGLHHAVGQMGYGSAFDGFSRGVDKFREDARFFFNEAEVMNQSVAYGIAWREARQTYGSAAAIRRPEVMYEVARRTEDYSLNMKRESSSAWQSGLLSLPTQFWSYNIRMLEALFGRQFTGPQKMRLLAMQFGLAGSAATPPTYIISEWIKAQTGEAPDADTVAGVIDRGFIDALLAYGGTDVSFGQRWGTGSMIPEFFKELFGLSDYGPTAPADVIFGATFSIGGQLGKTIGDVLKYSAAEVQTGNMEMTQAALKGLAANVSTVSNAMKGYMAFKYGTYVSNRGTTMLDGVNDSQAVFVALGFAPGQMSQFEAVSTYNKQKTKMVQEATRVMQNYHTRWLNEEDNRDAINAERKAFMELQDPEVAAQVRKRMRNLTGERSMLERLEKQALRNKQLDQAYSEEASGESN